MKVGILVQHYPIDVTFDNHTSKGDSLCLHVCLSNYQFNNLIASIWWR